MKTTDSRFVAFVPSFRHLSAICRLSARIPVLTGGMAICNCVTVCLDTLPTDGTWHVNLTPIAILHFTWRPSRRLDDQEEWDWLINSRIRAPSYDTNEVLQYLRSLYHNTNTWSAWCRHPSLPIYQDSHEFSRYPAGFWTSVMFRVAPPFGSPKRHPPFVTN